jgi:Transposase domain (DUF772)
VQVNFAYRWFCKLGIEHKIPDHSAFSRARNERFRDSGIFRRVRQLQAIVFDALDQFLQRGHRQLQRCIQIGNGRSVRRS